MNNPIKKLVSYPEHVWHKVEEMVMREFNIKTPRYPFDIQKYLLKYIYSRRFEYKRFVANISERQAMVLFTFICRKMGIMFIEDSNSWKVVTVKESADQLLEYVKQNVFEDVEEVTQPV